MSEFAGTLQERVTIERPITTRTATGLQEAGWEKVASCLAAIQLEGAGPESEAMALSSMARLRVTIRRREGIAVGQRINWNARVAMIRQVLDDPRFPERLALRCEEVRQ